MNRNKTKTNTQELSGPAPIDSADIHWGNKLQAFTILNPRVKINIISLSIVTIRSKKCTQESALESLFPGLLAAS